MFPSLIPRGKRLIVSGGFYLSESFINLFDLPAKVPVEIDTTCKYIYSQRTLASVDLSLSTLLHHK